MSECHHFPITQPKSCPNLVRQIHPVFHDRTCEGGGAISESLGQGDARIVTVSEDMPPLVQVGLD